MTPAPTVAVRLPGSISSIAVIRSSEMTTSSGRVLAPATTPVSPPGDDGLTARLAQREDRADLGGVARSHQRRRAHRRGVPVAARALRDLLGVEDGVLVEQLPQLGEDVRHQPAAPGSAP